MRCCCGIPLGRGGGELRGHFVCLVWAGLGWTGVLGKLELGDLRLVGCPGSRIGAFSSNRSNHLHVFCLLPRLQM